MKYGIALWLLATGAHAATPEDLDWLAGCWAFEKNGKRTEEVWLVPAADQAIGLARTLKNGQTLTREFLRIEANPDGSLDYVSIPSGQAETRFRLTTQQARSAVFENLQHDFPTRIRYARSADDRLDAAIEGPANGKIKTIEYPFRRVSCPNP